MKIVADTNTIVSGLIWPGPPRRLLDNGFAAGWRFFTSLKLLAELERVLRYEKLAKAIAVRGQTPAALFSLAMSLLKPVEPALLDAPVSRDPDDDHVIACAIGANANMIVTGDKDLLVLGQFQGIAILSASQAIAQLAK